MNGYPSSLQQAGADALSVAGGDRPGALALLCRWLDERAPPRQQLVVWRRENSLWELAVEGLSRRRVGRALRRRLKQVTEPR